MGDPPFEHRIAGEFLVKMNRVHVARNTGKENDVGLGNGFSVGRAHPHAQVFEIVAVNVVQFRFRQHAILPLEAKVVILRCKIAEGLYRNLAAFERKGRSIIMPQCKIQFLPARQLTLGQVLRWRCAERSPEHSDKGAGTFVAQIDCDGSHGPPLGEQFQSFLQAQLLAPCPEGHSSLD